MTRQKWCIVQPKVALKKSKKILKHRTSTVFEDLIFIDSNNPENIMKRIDYNKLKKVRPSKKMFKMLNANPAKSIIAIHNHPDSFAPSFADIATAYKRKYKYGAVVAHNGTIFKYSIIDEKYNELNALFAVENYRKVVYANNDTESEIYKKAIYCWNKNGDVLNGCYI